MRLTFYLVLWGTVVAVCSRNNDFPFYLHADENGKVRQIESKNRNFHHPTLMLECVQYARKAVEESRKLWHARDIAKGKLAKKLTYQEIAELGRLFSAIHTATAIVFLTLVAEHLIGVLGAFCCGLMLLANKLLYRYAHFFKEEPTLILGMAVLLFTLVILHENPRARRAWIAAGFGLAAATAGKYVGVVFTLTALPFVWWFTRVRPDEPASAISRGPGARATILLSFLVCVGVLHHEVLAQIVTFSEGFAREWDGVSRGHQGMRGETGLFFYLTMLSVPLVMPLSVMLLASGYGVALIARRREVALIFWVPPVAALTYFAIISASPKYALKYILPSTMLLTLMAGMSLATLVHYGWRHRWGWKGWPALAAAVVLTAGYFVPQASSIMEADGQWKVDNTAVAWNWIRDHLPADARLLPIPAKLLPTRDQWVYRDIPFELPQQIVSDRSSIDSEPGAFEQLIADGVTHLIVSPTLYQRYLGGNEGVTEEIQTDLENRANFYRRMQAEGKLVFELPLGAVIEIQKGIEIFELPVRKGR